jgi:hypothetical protein
MNIVFINYLLLSDFQPFWGKNNKVVTAKSSLSNNYCLRVTAEGAIHNAQKPLFNTEIILTVYSAFNQK